MVAPKTGLAAPGGDRGVPSASATPRRCSIPGSAVCAFYLADVERAFEGPFAEPRGATGTWVPVPEDRVPRPRYPSPDTLVTHPESPPELWWPLPRRGPHPRVPTPGSPRRGPHAGVPTPTSPRWPCRRPGCCAGTGAAAAIATSGDFPDETLTFAKEHPLLHGAVAPAGGRPLFTRTGARCTPGRKRGGRGDRVRMGTGWPRGQRVAHTRRVRRGGARVRPALWVLRGWGGSSWARARARPRARRVRGCAGRRLTQLAADTGAGPGANQTVLFLGAEDGRVLKVLVAMRHPGATQRPGGTPAPGDSQEPGDAGDAGSETLLLEEISLYEPGR